MEAKSNRNYQEYQDWTEKYRPTDLSDVVGNKKAIRELKTWAGKWVSGKPSKKAVVLAGKAGIGKTSSAIALANHMNWEVLEMNASDRRNRDSIKKFVGRSAVDDTFSESGEFTPYKDGKRTLLVIDEADNIFGKEDRGGINEISSTIKKTEQPVILIANDYYDMTRRSKVLKNLCKKIDFKTLDKKEIKTHLRKICQSEGIEYQGKVLDRIAEYSEGDLRSAVRDLESICAGKERIKVEDLTVLGGRNREADIFPTLKKILKNQDILGAKKSVRSLNEEPSDLITWIDENLPREYDDDLELYEGYRWLAKSDVYLGKVRSRQAYRLWTYSTSLMTAGVCSAKNHRHSGWTKYAFPQWIRKMSESKGKRSMKRRISKKISPKIHTTTEKFRSQLIHYIVYLMKEEADFREYAVKEWDLDPPEVAYLLGEKEDSKEVRSLFSEKSEEISRKKDKSQEEKKEDKERDEEEQRSLLEF
ncbi:MAG: replication factor C large subunit [Candidatus Thermoplasmatota archaeon]|nr:replication factor C large subunit [Candidatus Thermoplasmatota archaeon]MBS3789503.1 replication factor C large subunit [Candidatus Thermoplasmatota archaeon]